MLSCKKCGGKVNPYLVVRNGEGSIVYICEKCDTGSEKLEEWDNKTYRKFRADYSVQELEDKFKKELLNNSN